MDELTRWVKDNGIAEVECLISGSQWRPAREGSAG